MTTLSKTELFSLAQSLREFGVYNEPLAARWTRVIDGREEQDTPICAVAALNNGDTDHALLALVRQFPREVMEGLCHTAAAVDAADKILVLPEGEQTLGEELSGLAQEYGVSIQYGIVDVRQYRGSAIHHLQTMIALAQSARGEYQPGTWVAVRRDGTTGAVKKIPFGTALAGVVGETQGLYAFAIGRRLYRPESLSMTVQPDTTLDNGVITLYPDSCCLVAEGERELLACRRQSCGKCTFCREGLIQLYTHTSEMTQGKGKPEALEMMAEIGQAMTFSALCSLGQTGGAFTLSALELFPEEYEDHLKHRTCRSQVCTAFTSIYIDPARCTGCEECADVCPADCIEGKAGFIHMIDDFECTKCGKCIQACEEGAVIRTNGRVPKLPTRLTKCGRFH